MAHRDTTKVIMTLIPNMNNSILKKKFTAKFVSLTYIETKKDKPTRSHAIFNTLLVCHDL